MRTPPLLIAVVALAACGEDSEQPIPISETRTATENGDVVVRLLDQGAEPRRVLRYELTEWEGGKATMRMKMSMRMRRDGQDSPHEFALPLVQAQLSYTPGGVDENGNIHFEFAVAKMELVDAEPEMAALFDEATGVSAGMKGSCVITPSGHLVEYTLEIPDHAPPATKQMLDAVKGNLRRLTTPFPELPVGAGAHWDVSVPADVVGLGMDISVSYRVEELTPLGATIRTEIAMTGSGKLTLPGLKVSDVQVESMRSEAAGTLRLDLRSLAPAMELESRTAITMVSEATGRLEQDLEMRMEVVPAR